jgi:hypothetical protein
MHSRAMDLSKFRLAITRWMKKMQYKVPSMNARQLTGMLPAVGCFLWTSNNNHVSVPLNIREHCFSSKFLDLGCSTSRKSTFMNLTLSVCEPTSDR